MRLLGSTGRRRTSTAEAPPKELQWRRGPSTSSSTPSRATASPRPRAGAVLLERSLTWSRSPGKEGGPSNGKILATRTSTASGRPKPTLRKSRRRSPRIGSRRSLRLSRASARRTSADMTRTRTSIEGTSGRSPTCCRRDMIGTRSLAKRERPSTVNKKGIIKDGPGACRREVVFVRGSTTATTASFPSDAFTDLRATAKAFREYYRSRVMGIYCYQRR
mmetsp:Transcript_17954/g.51153  ORF Transcript_17954/g.51153 Transcript_17954/m.51153 type:complete len:219 (-) Transcript_17954:848-1504(-)